MATRRYDRKTADAAPNKYSWQFINRNEADYNWNSLVGTVPAATAALPAVSATVQEYVPYSQVISDTIVCAGTVLKIGDTYGILKNDTVAGDTTGVYVTSGRFYMQIHGSATPAIGADCYIASSDMLVSEDATAREYIGVFESVAETNPDGLPAGDYAVVWLKQTEK